MNWIFIPQNMVSECVRVIHSDLYVQLTTREEMKSKSNPNWSVGMIFHSQYMESHKIPWFQTFQTTNQ